jgi:hypothetical protein
MPPSDEVHTVFPVEFIGQGVADKPMRKFIVGSGGLDYDRRAMHRERDPTDGCSQVGLLAENGSIQNSYPITTAITSGSYALQPVRACSLRKGTLENCAFTNSSPTGESFCATAPFSSRLKRI